MIFSNWWLTYFNQNIVLLLIFCFFFVFLTLFNIFLILKKEEYLLVIFTIGLVYLLVIFTICIFTLSISNISNCYENGEPKIDIIYSDEFSCKEYFLNENQEDIKKDYQKHLNLIEKEKEKELEEKNKLLEITSNLNENNRENEK